jgi:hypothetical protein
MLEPSPEQPPTPRWYLTFADVPIAFFWGLMFWVLNKASLPNGDLWGHVVYGSWILDHGSLPTDDPMMPLAAGIGVVDDTWLSQVILAAVEGAGGFDWLSNLFAVLVVVTYLFLARACYLVSGSKWVASAGVLAALYLAWERSATFHAETFGALCFAVLLWLVAGSGAGTGDRPPRRSLWLAVPALFVLWANLHPSFVFGLAVLGCCVAGRIVDVGRDARSVGRVLEDRALRRWLVLGELAAAATLVNPYGLGLILHVMGWAPQGIPRGPQGWQLSLQGGSGLALVLSFLLFAVLAASGGRKTPAAHVLLLVFFAAAAAAAARDAAWYAPVFAVVSMPLWSDAWSRWRAARGRRQEPADAGPPGCLGRSRIHTLVCAMILGTAFVLSPLGLGLFWGLSRTVGQILHPSTPLGVTGYLQANPPSGQIYNPLGWGDWLAFDGPPGLAPFVTSRVEQVPYPVWTGYQRLQQAGYEWERILRRFRIDTVVAETGSRLARALRFTDGWSLAYDDFQAQVFVRVPLTGEVREAPPDEAGDAGETHDEETSDE